MNVKKWLSQLKKKAGKVKFPKPNKSKVELKPRKISQKTANRLLLGFVAGVVLLSALTIVSNTFRSLRNDKNQIQVTNKNTRTYSNQVSLFMTDFLNIYFSENNAENQAKLKEYYGSGILLRKGRNGNQTMACFIYLMLLRIINSMFQTCLISLRKILMRPNM